MSLGDRNVIILIKDLFFLLRVNSIRVLKPSFLIARPHTETNLRFIYKRTISLSFLSSEETLLFTKLATETSLKSPETLPLLALKNPNLLSSRFHSLNLLHLRRSSYRYFASLSLALFLLKPNPRVSVCCVFVSGRFSGKTIVFFFFFVLFAICVTIYLFLGVSDLEFVGFGSCVELSVLEFRFWVFELLRSGVFFFLCGNSMLGLGVFCFFGFIIESPCLCQKSFSFQNFALTSW